MKHREEPSHRLWYRKGATVWEEALPLGNGRLGAMVWGQEDREILDLNEDTLWSGFPRDDLNYDARRFLPKVRELLAENRAEEAQALLERTMLGSRCESYQPLGRLTVHRWGELLQADFQRELNLETGIASAPDREVFVSAPDQVVVFHWGFPGDYTLELECLHPHQRKRDDQGFQWLSGRCPSHVADNFLGDHPEPVVYEEGLGISFAAAWKVVAPGGEQIWSDGGCLRVLGALSLTVLLTASGNTRGSPEARCRAALEKACVHSYEALKLRHVAEHRALFERFHLALGPQATELNTLPTDERLDAWKRGKTDPSLVALYAQYGRYLLMACSRPGTEPANLQGLWNPHVMPPWNSDYTTNINTPMNYWPAEAANLADCHEPLFRLIADLEAPGRRVARLHYGCRGWAAHHNVDFWRKATPTDGDASWAFWPMAGVWLAGHLMEHWRYGQDRGFLRDRVWTLMKGAAEFALDWLIEGPDGTLTTSPSTSPENRWLTPEGKAVALTTGSACDRSLIRHLLEGLLEAAEVLQLADPVLEAAEAALGRLEPMIIDPHGRIREWATDLPEAEPGHRHFSSLFGLYPGDEVGEDLRLREACEATIRRRLDHGGGHTGWSCAWLVNLWARLGKGEEAGAAVTKLLAESTLSNLLDNHPPFQIDGNFGGLAGILEMLCQSHLGEIHLLPALPSEWSQGRCSGLRARGGFLLSIAWEQSRLVSATITASVAGPCRVRWPQGASAKTLLEGESWTLSFEGVTPCPS